MSTTQHDAAPPGAGVAPPERPAPPPIVSPYGVPFALPPTPVDSGLPPGQALPPVRPHRVLSRLVVSLAVFAVGVVALVDVAGAHVPASVYFGVPLTVVGAGLVLGAWYGRARGLIAFGIVLGLLLAMTAAVETWGPNSPSRSVNWRPASVTQLATNYEINVGNAVLDLSGVEFTGQTTSVRVHVSVGNLHVLLPPTVDVEVHSRVHVGNSTVLGQEWNGIDQDGHTVTDEGADGPGGGKLTIDASVNMGNLEVRR